MTHFLIESTDGETRAEIIPELGGIVSSLRLNLRHEILYRHDWFWDPHTDKTRGGIPLLFPICGRLENSALPIHGFASRLPWRVSDATRPDTLRLELTSTPATLAMYPYPFALELQTTVTPFALTCQLTVRNTGPAPMPYYAGFHPYFLTPPPGAGKEQTHYTANAIRRHIYNPTKTDIIAEAPPPAFPIAANEPAINDLLLELGDNPTTTLTFPDGTHIQQTASPHFRFRQLYTLPDHPFFCDEPWMAPPGTLHHPLPHHLLPPNTSATHQTQIKISISNTPTRTAILSHR